MQREREADVDARHVASDDRPTTNMTTTNTGPNAIKQSWHVHGVANSARNVMLNVPAEDVSSSTDVTNVSMHRQDDHDKGESTGEPTRKQGI